MLVGLPGTAPAHAVCRSAWHSDPGSAKYVAHWLVVFKRLRRLYPSCGERPIDGSPPMVRLLSNGHAWLRRGCYGIIARGTRSFTGLDDQFDAEPLSFTAIS